MIAKNDFDRQELLDCAAGCQQAISPAVRRTLIEHKLLGQPIVVDDGNGPRWIPAEEIEIPEPVEGPEGRLPTEPKS